jgi:porphobilinogen deaminase
VGAYAVQAGADRLCLQGVVLGVPAAAEDETVVVRERGEADAADAARLGRELAARMLAVGAQDLIGAMTDRDDAHD